jgi:hypothetical protein
LDGLPSLIRAAALRPRFPGVVTTADFFPPPAGFPSSLAGGGAVAAVFPVGLVVTTAGPARGTAFFFRGEPVRRAPTTFVFYGHERRRPVEAL